MVLVLTSLAAGLLMQASTQVLGLQQRLNAQLERLRGPQLGADWLRQVVQGLQPDYSDGAHVFKGTERGFAALTTNPLSGSYGGLAPFAVVLDYDGASDSTALRYAAGAVPGVVVARLADALPEVQAATVDVMAAQQLNRCVCKLSVDHKGCITDNSLGQGPENAAVAAGRQSQVVGVDDEP